MSGESGIKRAINSTLYGNRFTVMIRILLGAMLVFSGSLKIIDPEAFGRVITRYDILPGVLVAYAALMVPALEIVSGLSLLIGCKVRGSAFIAMLLMAAFLVFILVNVARGRQFDCGCFNVGIFGLDFAETVSPWLAARNVIFIAGFALVFRARRHLFSLEHYIEKSRLKNLEKTKYE
jgi:putative oxidoreductase